MTSDDVRDLGARMDAGLGRVHERIDSVNKRIDPLAETAARIEQRINDRPCEDHAARLEKVQGSVEKLKRADVRQEGNVRSGLRAMVVQLVGLLIVLVPLAVALWHNLKPEEG